MYKIKFKDGTTKEFKSLREANLRGACLEGASLEGANLSGAYLFRTEGIITFQGDQHLAFSYKFKDTIYIQIGCENHTREHWLKEYVNIGRNNGYTIKQIEQYGNFIKYVSGVK